MIIKRLPKPTSHNKTHRETEMWVDEAIWGHRLYDEQTPWLTLLEFLGIVQTQLEREQAFIEPENHQLEYPSYSRLYLRNILFNNPFLEAVYAEYPTEEERWQQWLTLMNDNCGGINTPNFSYLQERFIRFRDFLEVVRFLQSNAIEGDSNKRWTSKFVFPYGVNCLYEDLRISKNSYSNDRRFFARNGELLYLMISRSSLKLDILTHLKKLGIIDHKQSSKWNKLVATLQPNDHSDTKPRGKDSSPPYLPYEHLDEFENLANDWINLFNCHLPDYDSLPHLVTITGVHLVIYLLKRAKAVLNNEDDPRFSSESLLNSQQNLLFKSETIANTNEDSLNSTTTLNSQDKPQLILEIIAPKKTIIRDLASDAFLNNNNLSKRAVEHYIKRLSQLPEWQTCLNSANSIEDALEIIKEEIYYKKDEIKCNSPDELLEEIRLSAITRHKQHVGQFHSKWTKEIGLASSRGSRRTRYAPTDSLLKTLVLCCVPKRMEFQEFLDTLYQKYGFIIGEKQAIDIIQRKEADLEAFSDNAERLEQRLASLGLLKRLSDACAYVLNPYTVEKT
ncbi:hypothetical protein cce_5236 (plasmid) [Crocosphaera subtropica ATCC 51142]|uniref:Uncharacterized protein n=1 Tax=Crocosphaera subtropica (strain ATCC 51142 / BH68) TaxID=43989 RepID=B1X371_CROS5|nr:hypothetical protein [Crocosphaera subtropica]ACB54582.1 hypothetical protein cce_5236 [Crocosphaera subtropica ATCC 51142]